MTIPYDHNTPDVVLCQYCSEDFEKESPYIRYVYRRTKDNCRVKSSYFLDIKSIEPTALDLDCPD